MPMPRRKGFTLIELLVVITIVVVLLALLTPALDKAIHEAQMAVCATNLRAIGAGFVQYATNSKRYYPNRLNTIDVPTVVKAGGADDRPLYEAFLSLNGALNDPFLPDLDFNTSAMHQYSTKHMYPGWGSWPDGTLRRLGDRLVWTEDGKRDSFPWMVADQTYHSVGGGIVSAHPDYEGRLGLKHLQSQNAATADQTPPTLIGTAADVSYTYAWWLGAGDGYGTFDYNYTATDLSTVRYNGVVYNNPSGENDPRFSRVPLFGYPPSEGAAYPPYYPQYQTQLPISAP